MGYRDWLALNTQMASAILDLWGINFPTRCQFLTLYSPNGADASLNKLLLLLLLLPGVLVKICKLRGSQVNPLVIFKVKQCAYTPVFRIHRHCYCIIGTRNHRYHGHRLHSRRCLVIDIIIIYFEDVQYPSFPLKLTPCKRQISINRLVLFGVSIKAFELRWRFDLIS